MNNMTKGDGYFDLTTYIETYLYIRAKNKKLIPFKLNRPQRIHQRRVEEAAKRGRFRHIILKARQMGFTTFELARMYNSCITTPYLSAALVAHEKDTTKKLLEIPKTFYANLTDAERPPLAYDNREEYYFAELGSRMTIGTAGASTFGRGLTIQHLHASEYAFWPDAETLMTGLTESIPMESGWITIESTPNGVGGPFYDLYMDAKEGGEYEAHFYPWFLDDSYSVAPSEGEEFILTEAEKELQDKVQRDWKLTLSPGQILFRRWKQRSLKRKFAQEYPEDDITCFVVAGQTVFDGEMLRALMMHHTKQPLEVAEPYSIKGRETFALKIWEFPEPGVEYVMGSDVAEGEVHDAGLDFCDTVVLRKSDGQEVARLHGQWPPHIFARKTGELGERYNDALWGCERNNHGHSVLNTASNVMHYPNLYVQERFDTQARVEREVLGWLTDQATKPLMIDDLNEALDHGNVVLHDEDFYREAFAFEFKQRGKMGAREGAHDDRVMSTAIANQMRKVQKKSAGFLFLGGM